MFTKDSLRKDFAREWKKHYQVKLFKDMGFHRKTCRKCRKHFWTLDEKRNNCPDPPCENYGFIGNPITKRKWDYVETWKQFERFFKKEGHTSIPRYPVIDRWRPDLFFTIASIQDFQRIDQGNIVFEYPADPLVIPQMCLRFNDIPNVGITGRHHTSFIMPGQHSFGRYWKDRCIELNFGFLNRVMGIPEKEITYVEDIWTMPDFSAFGPCIETYSRGLELVNSVFMQFTKVGNKWKELPKRVVDVGWGHERLVWFTQGTPTGYDAVFGPVVKWAKKRIGMKDSELFDQYSILAGGLDFDQAHDLKKIRNNIARRLGVKVAVLNGVVEPMQALYAIIDHTKTLLFAIIDGGIPSNVGGGYNLRVLLRRVLSFMKEFEFDLELEKIVGMHTKHLHPMFPEIAEGTDPFSKILAIERDRYSKTMEKAGLLIKRELERGRIDEKTLTKFYISHGISPELVEKVAREKNIRISIPEDFYVNITEQHMMGEKEKEEKERVWVDVTGIPRTKPLYYNEPYKKEFKAKILKTIKAKDGEWVILDKTLFYPEGGGQPSDLGFLKIGDSEFRVKDVQKIGSIVVHKIVGAKGLKKNQGVKGSIDWERRYQLMKMHTSTHIVAGAARKVIGSHVWQAGAQKGVESSRIDLTHYRSFTDEEMERIEKIANDAVSRDFIVHKEFLPRNIAENRYSFVLYQGGASPGKMVRVINIGHGFDAEACGGMHLDKTGEAEVIKIIRTERIKDGVNRIEFTCSKKAYEFVQEQERVAGETLKVLEKLGFQESISDIMSKEMDFHKELEKASRVFSIETKHLPKTIERFCREIKEDYSRIKGMKKQLGVSEEAELKEILEEKLKEVKTFEDLSKTIFGFWKEQKKEIENLRKDASREKAKKLLFKAKKDRVFEVVSGDRKELIEIANELISTNPELTVILSNESGDIIGMSRTRNMSKVIRDICQKAGGSGGGNKELAQGRVELSKLLKIIGRV